MRCFHVYADLEKVLPANEFCRPIRWALVSMREIVAMPTDILKLSDKTEIPHQSS